MSTGAKPFTGIRWWRDGKKVRRGAVAHSATGARSVARAAVHPCSLCAEFDP